MQAHDGYEYGKLVNEKSLIENGAGPAIINTKKAIGCGLFAASKRWTAATLNAGALPATATAPTTCVVDRVVDARVMRYPLMIILGSSNSSSRVVAIVAAACAALVPVWVSGHGTEARYIEIAQWQKPHFNKVFATDRNHLTTRVATRPASTATTTTTDRVLPRAKSQLQMRTIDGKSCVFHDVLGFDVDNSYAFDVDEPVTFKVTFIPELSTPFVIGWDKNGGTGMGQTPEIIPDTSAGIFQTVSVTLDRARLAGQGVQGSDIALSARNGIALCDIEIVRSNTTQPRPALGTIKFIIKDAKTGTIVPARVGLYDATGRAPLASDQSLMLQRFADDIRMLPVNERTFWPSENRQAFYVDGKYEAKVPAGSYELVATRGMEFRAFHSKVEVKENQTSSLTISLERYANMPSKGWYSGDSHIHLTRDVVADPVVWGMVAAEDVYVGNLLEMGNISGTHFKQPKEWGKASRFERDGHFIVSGQEDPRTWFLGHTIHHNLQTPLHAEAGEYFLYDKIFKASHAQGGVSGFAHMGWGQRGADPAQLDRGLAMLAPYGLVDFIEVLQGGRLVDNGWYRLLNLGMRITPAAGSDWPYTDFPGIVRNYVKLDGPLNLDKWFESFRAGHVYVTNGPLLEFTINGQQMGEELHVKRGTKLNIATNARLNPDVDALDRIELVALGDVMQSESANGKDQVTLNTQIVADHSMWIAARAWGSHQSQPGTTQGSTIAHSAPIYVVVDDEPTWKVEALPGIIADARAQLERLQVEPIDATNDLEYWETRTLLADEWLAQRPLLRPTIVEADKRYQQLLEHFGKFSHPSPSASTAGPP